VTTPQAAAADVAQRAGSIATQTHQRIAGVLENMSWLELPDGSRLEVFGSGGGRLVADALSATMGTDVPLLGQIPLDVAVREGGDSGVPIVLRDGEQTPAAEAFRAVAHSLATKPRGLAGRPLGITPL